MFKRILKRSAAMAGAAGLACAAAQAAVIVDPENVGLNGVSPSQNWMEDRNIGGTVDFDNSWLNIGTTGSFGGSGALLLNAENITNGITSLVNVGTIALGGVSGRSGELRIVGDGTAGSASIDVLDHVRLGDGGDASIIIEAGGHLTASERVTDRGGDSVIRVDGAGSLLRATGVLLGYDVGGESSVTVSGGGVIDVIDDSDGFSGPVFIGQAFTGSPLGAGGVGDLNTLTVTGAGSTLQSTGDVVVGSKGTSWVEVLDGGRISTGDQFALLGIGDVASGLVSGSSESGASRVDAANIDIGGISLFSGWVGGVCCDPVRSDTHGSLRIENGSVVTAQNAVNVSSEDAAGSGVLTISSGGVLEAPVVNVFAGGVLNGDGGTIIGDVVVNGGTVAPGNSPGAMLIDGDLTFASIGSVLEIEIAGNDPGAFDMLEVMGDLVAPEGFTLELSFLNGFAPGEGDVFEFLNVEGMLDFATLTVITSGLSEEFSLDVAFTPDGVFSAVATAAPSEVPVPGAGVLLLTGLGGLFAARRRNRARGALCSGEF